jgi:acetyl-CoA carboxylase biotin carboxyl carrier protein
MARRTIRAEMAGVILSIERRAGDAVELDDVVLVMESMKMEIPICAPRAGKVVEILVAADEAVAEDQPLAVLEI